MSKEKIGLYAGSFNPFHIGHYNILTKAEAIFDYVILGFGVNPEKEGNLMYPLPETIKDRKIIHYGGLLTDLIDSLGYDVTLIRGLRNTTDLQSELTQYRYLQGLKPNIKVVSIFCDHEFEHVSSSSIRLLQKYGKGDEYMLK